MHLVGVHDRYQGFSITLDALPRTGSATGVAALATKGDGSGFRLVARVTDSYAGTTGERASDIVGPLALRIAHGLIDTGRFESVAAEEEYLVDSYWNPYRADPEATDGYLRAELLEALFGIHRAQVDEFVVLYLDIEGLALILEVNPARLRGVLADLLLEGLAEPYAESFGQRAADGRCRITATGIQELRTLKVTQGDATTALLDWTARTGGVGQAWADLEVRLAGLKAELDTAETKDDLQDAGRRCREVLIDAANAVFTDSMVPEGTPVPSMKDAKVRIDMALARLIPGPAFDELRSLVNSVWRLAQATTHSDNVTHPHAYASAQATVLLVRTLQEIQQHAAAED